MFNARRGSQRPAANFMQLSTLALPRRLGNAARVRMIPHMIPPPDAPSRRLPPQVLAALVIAVAGVVLFHFFGNATRGYIKTASLFWWWISQWLDPNSETEHGWLVLGIAAWVGWKNLGRPETGNRKPETTSKPETGDRKPDSAERKPEIGNRKLETSGGEADSADSKPESEGATQQNVAAERVSSEELRDRPPASVSPVSGFRSPVSLEGSPVPAIVAILSALLLHALGFVAQQSRVSIVALLVFAWGVLRLGGGRRWGAAMAFPLAFMVFAIPLSVLDEIGLPLRLWVTTAGETIARAGGIDVVRNGTQLIAPDGRFNYDVAAPCSGVRSLMALTALAVLMGYLNFRSWSRRLLVFAFSFPLVYLGNVARIVAIIFAAQIGGAAWGDRAHAVMGYGVFAIVLGGLMLVVSAINRWWPESRLAHDAATAAPTDEAARSLHTPRWIGAAAAVVVGLAVIEMVFLHRLAQSPARGEVGVVLDADGVNPVELPAFLGTEWIGQRTEVTAVEREILPPDTGFSRKNYAFVGDRSRDVFLSIVLSGRDRTSIHRPELCLVGQGWTIRGSEQQTFRFPGADNVSDDFRATVLRVQREIPSPRGKLVVPQLVAYWFVGGRTVVPSHWGRFLHDAWNRVTGARADRWAYVLMQTDARDGEAAAIARMQKVLDETLPVFQRPAAARR
jgi:EpsI family protein